MGAKTRVLFVDDEENILRGLRRMLRKKRDDWEMAFLTSGEKALGLIDHAPADVVITDMRMPGMDGAQLLNEIRKRHPATVRIILSGFSEEESVLRTVGPAQQYLAKPCDAEAVIGTIERALAMRKVIDSEALRTLVSGVKSLPTPSAVYLELLDELDSLDSSAQAVADIVARDVGLSAQILKLTNSAYFSLPMKVASPLRAVQMLGFDTVKALVLVSGFFKQFSGSPKTERALERLSQRCLVIGALAKAIAYAENTSRPVGEQAGCAGVLSHVGTLILLGNWPGKFARASDLADAESIPISEAEARVFGAGHAEIGGYLLGLWGFSDPIVEAVTFHHHPQAPSARKIDALALVHVAQHLCRTGKDTGQPERHTTSQLDGEYLEALGIACRLPVWAGIAREVLEKRDANDE